MILMGRACFFRWCWCIFSPNLSFDASGPVLGLVRICDRTVKKEKQQILDDSFLDTFKINLGIGIDPVYNPDFKKLLILMVFDKIDHCCIRRSYL